MCLPRPLATGPVATDSKQYSNRVLNKNSQRCQNINIHLKSESICLSWKLLRCASKSPRCWWPDVTWLTDHRIRITWPSAPWNQMSQEWRTVKHHLCLLGGFLLNKVVREAPNQSVNVTSRYTISAISWKLSLVLGWAVHCITRSRRVWQDDTCRWYSGLIIFWTPLCIYFCPKVCAGVALPLGLHSGRRHVPLFGVSAFPFLFFSFFS